MKNIKKDICTVFIALLLLVVLFSVKENNRKDNIDNEKNNSTNTSLENFGILRERAIIEALQLYTRKRADGINFSSQCLGVVANRTFVVDIVHIPRIAEDNLPENQCEEFLRGNIRHFVELDKNGNLIRVI